MPDFEQLSTIGAGAALACVTVLLTFLENIDKIRVPHLKYSIVGCLVSFTTSTTFVAAAWRSLFQGDAPGFADRMICATAFYDLGFTLLTYHSAYRTIRICLPFYRNVHWAAAGVALTQMLVHGSASLFWARNMKANFGTQVDTTSQKLELVVLVYYSVVESALFVITQYKIIETKAATMVGGATKRLKALMYLSGSMRSIAYIANICMGFVALGNVLPVTSHWNFPMYGPPFLVIIILTDSGRFQNCMESLTGEQNKSSSHSKHDSSKNPNSKVHTSATRLDSA
ncbi:hypothetical protein DFS34DRAFT_639404 [Phlyctochytrium arcticum]|nr:hypothetical protein DFS34DRAFT_639404 [Phlyctochytrium arcticum]